MKKNLVDLQKEKEKRKKEFKIPPGEPGNLFNINFTTPPGFKITMNGIFRKTYSEEGEKIGPKILPMPVIVSGRAIDIDSDWEDLELTFPRNGCIKKIWAPREETLSAKMIQRFSKYGLPVHSENSKKLVSFLFDFETENITQIPTKKITRKNGWKNNKFFVLGKEKIGDPDADSVELKIEEGFDSLAKAITKKGTMDNWKTAVSNIIKSSPKAAFTLFASFAAPLLKPLGASNFIIHFWGQSSRGKTTALELAASVWGDPNQNGRGLIQSWQTTACFIERAAEFYNDLPVFLDESQLASSPQAQSLIAYSIANGAGKGRGSITGVRATNRFNTILISTGEKSLIESSQNEGIRARAIEFFGSPFPMATKEDIHSLKHSIYHNFGLAGPEYLSILIKKTADTDFIKDLKARFQKEKNLFLEKADSEILNRVAHYFALAAVTSDLVCDSIGLSDKELHYQQIWKLFSDFKKEAGQNFDIGDRAMEAFLSWFNENQDFFLTEKNNSDIQARRFGIHKNDDYIAVYPHVLDEVLAGRLNFNSPRLVLNLWKEKNYIQTSSEGKNTVPVKFKGEVKRAIKIDLKKLGHLA